jgi:hypothetical protein
MLGIILAKKKNNTLYSGGDTEQTKKTNCMRNILLFQVVIRTREQKKLGKDTERNRDGCVPMELLV